MLKVLIIQVIVMMGSSHSYQIIDKWYCRNNMDCLPWKLSDAQSVPKTYESQNLCRLMCGKYRGIWPQVTGTCNIGRFTERINTNHIRFDYPDDNEGIREFFDQTTFLFLKNLNDECGRTCNMPSDNSLFIKIAVNENSLALNSQTDESYQISISTTSTAGNQVNVQILAQTVFGTRHALETLSQLMVRTSDDNERVGLLIVSNAEISDKPFYQHRGLLVDTARHFIPTASLLKILDGMSANKMNVFHWHITDSQSFPMETKRVPQMSSSGAFSKYQVYRKDEIEGVVKYGKFRGIRVIFELDAPAHAGHGWEWGEVYGLGKLAVCVDEQPWRKSCIQPNCGQLNPSNENLYSVLRDIYQDMRDYKEKGEFIHMGGDEVFMQCWNDTKEITDYMATKNYNRDINGFLQLWSEFQDRALNIWDNITEERESIVLWSSEMTLPENIEKFLPKDRYIIQTWLPDTSDVPKELLSKGYRIIMSTKNAWYLDHGFWGNTKYYNWKTVYANTLPKSDLVLGGEVCMWSEYVDEHSIEVKIFPRLNAAAERLWVGGSATDLKSVESRFNRQRERIIAKGIQTDAILPEFCTAFEGECR